MKPMFRNPVKFDCKRDDIKGVLKKQGCRNWWESMGEVASNKIARTKLKRLTAKEIQIELLNEIDNTNIILNEVFNGN